ncbi:MAG: 4-alpha-glucanotransferase [Spirochaetia bacterium]
MQFERASGILLHPTSLPGKYGIGDMGKQAYKFVDFLVKSRQKLWQLCPLGPTGYGDSPYQCFSAMAGNPLLISLEDLVLAGIVSEDDLTLPQKFPEEEVDYGPVIGFKYTVLRKAYANFKKKAYSLIHTKFTNFCDHHSAWLEDYTLFMALKNYFNGKPWSRWDDDIRLREPEAIERYKKELEDEIMFHKFLQYIFYDQWLQLRAYANRNYVKLIGDIPIFVSFDSSDAWANPEIFQFNEDRRPIKVAGVPPDYFSATGQLWGNPVYDWDKLEETGFAWWIENIKSKLELYDIIRIDHFRGFAAYWAVPAEEKTAIKGEWVPAKGYELFKTVEKALGGLPIIAEDLGVITPDVEELRDYFKFPGMKILQFAFDSSEENDYLPHNYARNCVVYTGTHDNDTVVGWYDKANEVDKKWATEYVNSNGTDVHWDFIRACWSSVAVMAVTPLQDVLGLGSEARMNTPGTASGNWQWRFTNEQLTDEHAQRLAHLSGLFNR